MEKVSVSGVDGIPKVLALVRKSGPTVYVCPIIRYREVIAGDEGSVVGFPASDVTDIREGAVVPA